MSSKCKITIDQKQFIFNSRSRMLDLKSNYRTGKGDLSCRACKSDNEETQRHLFQCPALSDSSLVTDNIPEYDEIMGQDTEKIVACSRIMKSKFNQFKMKINQTSALADATCSASD